MLSSLLPGVREVRTPLSAGSIWLLTIWLAVADQIPDEENAGRLMSRVYRLDDVVSQIGVGAAIGFSAYTLGLVMTKVRLHMIVFSPRRVWDVAAWTLLVRFPSFRLYSRLGIEPPRAGLLEVARRRRRGIETRPKAVRVAMADLIADAMPGEGWQAGTDVFDELPGSSPTLTPAVREKASDLIRGLRFIESRLRAESDGYGAEADRLRSEGEFRLSIVDPVAALAIAAFVLSHQWVYLLAAAVVPSVLYWDGRQREAEATVAALNSMRVDALDPAPSDLKALRQAVVESTHADLGTHLGSTEGST